MSRRPQHTTIAIIYDFDGTLSPNNMQEDTILKSYGIDKQKFWAKAMKLVREEGYERTLAYLKLLIWDTAFRQKPLRKHVFAKLASQIEYFPGVLEYFDDLSRFMKSVPEVKEWNIRIEHYIVSSGLKDILDGTAIIKHFKKVYACEYEYDRQGRPVFPKLVINDTNKTQFLFRINKGKLKLSESINSHTPEDKRRIPFRNMIYIGDGITDVPSMTVTQKNGGYAIAVFDPRSRVPKEVMQMVREKRADHFAPADFRADSLLVKILHRVLKKIILNISYQSSAAMSYDWVNRS